MHFSWRGKKKNRLAEEMKIFLSLSAKGQEMSSPLSSTKAEWPLHREGSLYVPRPTT